MGKAISEAAREAKNAYWREWAKKNPDKIRRYHEAYWERKAAEALAAAGDTAADRGGAAK